MFDSIPAKDPGQLWFMAGRSETTSSGKAPESLERKRKAKSGLTVFIVEDERLIAEDLKYIIEDSNWRVLGIASSGEEAVREVYKTKPDLVLMDVRIQGEVDGVHAAMVIQQSLTDKPRILFLSAHSREQFPHLNSLAPDSFAYLKKPYTPDDLVAAIELLLPELQDS